MYQVIALKSISQRWKTRVEGRDRFFLKYHIKNGDSKKKGGGT